MQSQACRLTGLTNLCVTLGQMHDAAEVLPTLLDSLCSTKEGKSVVNRIFSFSLEVTLLLCPGCILTMLETRRKIMAALTTCMASLLRESQDV